MLDPPDSRDIDREPTSLLAGLMDMAEVVGSADGGRGVRSSTVSSGSTSEEGQEESVVSSFSGVMKAEESSWDKVVFSSTTGGSGEKEPSKITLNKIRQLKHLYRVFGT